MQEYDSKEALKIEIQKTANIFIKEFNDVSKSDLDFRLNAEDRTPREILAYQLGWLELIQSWDKDELNGKKVITPSTGYKWNQMGELYQNFYSKYSTESLEQLIKMFNSSVSDLILWIDSFSDDELFKPGGRKWAQSTPSNWPVWKWIHMNTVAPFKSFRSKIRKWKKLRINQ